MLKPELVHVKLMTSMSVEKGVPGQNMTDRRGIEVQSQPALSRLDHLRVITETCFRNQDIPETSFRIQDIPETCFWFQDIPETSFRIQDIPERSFRNQDIPETGVS
jgi:hypothetical protein